MPIVQEKQSKKDFILSNFLGGVLQGLGGTIGIGIVLIIIGIIAKYVNLIPIVGKFVSDIVTYVLQNNPGLGN